MKGAGKPLLNDIAPSRPEAPGLSAEVEARIRGAESAIILPTLNEEAGLRSTLNELAGILATSQGGRVEVVVIDGGSTDRTVLEAQAAGVPVLRQRSVGKGAAVIEAFEWLSHVGVRYGVVLDADATYSPERTGSALALMRAGADLVIGVRNPVWGAPRDFRDLVHRAGNVALSATASLITRRAILDLCSGFWAMPTERFLGLGISAESFAIEAELVLKALRSGFTVYQIPVEFRERIGTAKLRAVRDGARIFLSILSHARPAPPVVVRPSMPVVPAVSQLLAIGAISGASTAIVESHPSRSREATALAGALRAKYIDASVVVREIFSEGRDTVPAWSPVTQVASPLLISLPSGGSERLSARSMTVSFRSQRRQLSIELTSESPVDAAPGPGAAPELSSARAGAYALPTPPTPTAGSRAVLRSRMDLDPMHRKQQLLVANGFDSTVAVVSPPPVPYRFLRKPIDPPPSLGTAVR